ncbi:MAG: C4-dicarboxylate ABC transporter substrate-binding protein, partial [Desulfobacterales bacterium]|nr:C4-dicarboxylate ABC transporter substrate-binding protein [Desulfobacterales bacterium]
MPMSSTPEALQRGVVQGLFSSLEVMKDYQFAEVCRYVTLTETVVYPFAVVMNLERWNSLPPEIQKVMNDLSLEQSEWTGTYMDEHVREAVDWSKKEHQVVFTKFSEADQAQSQALLTPMVNTWIQEAQAKGIPGQAVVDDIHALIQKYNTN